MIKFAEKLRELRLEKNLTQKELAKKTNISQSCIALWESNKRKPSLEYIILLAEFFGVSIDYLSGLIEF